MHHIVPVINNISTTDMLHRHHGDRQRCNFGLPTLFPLRQLPTVVMFCVYIDGYSAKEMIATAGPNEEQFLFCNMYRYPYSWFSAKLLKIRFKQMCKADYHYRYFPTIWVRCCLQPIFIMRVLHPPRTIIKYWTTLKPNQTKNNNNNNNFISTW